ncbi:hypothetical protein KCTC52924_02667 [Arenibacter antarcticus]|nr:hypothetical protein [Arenibacter sp. H213]
MITWSGKYINIPAELPEVALRATSPYQNRFFLGESAFGYSTPYCNWERWEDKIDWLAVDIIYGSFII